MRERGGVEGEKGEGERGEAAVALQSAYYYNGNNVFNKKRTGRDGTGQNTKEALSNNTRRGTNIPHTRRGTNIPHTKHR
jgi:hypothetical protein